jgi:hypothetical protein
MDDQVPDKTESTESPNLPERSTLSPSRYIKHGHKLVYGYLLLVILAAFAGYSGYIYYKYHATPKTTDAKASAQVTEKLLGKGRPPKGNYLDFREIGVKLLLNSSISNATYAPFNVVSTDGSRSFGISTKSIIENAGNKACTAAFGPLGLVIATTNPTVSAGASTTPLIVNHKTVFKFGDTYYEYVPPQGIGCSGGKVSLSQVEVDQSAFAQSFVSLELDGSSNNTYAGWQTLSNGQVSFKYPFDWTTINGPSGRGPDDFAIATSPAFSSSAVTATDEPGAQVTFIMQLSSESDTIGCDDTSCDVIAIVPLDNSQMPGAVLALVNQTSNNGSNFTQYVVVSGNTKVGDTSIKPVELGRSEVYIFGQPDYYPTSQGDISNAAQITNISALESESNFKDLVNIINSIKFN